MTTHSGLLLDDPFLGGDVHYIELHIKICGHTHIRQCKADIVLAWMCYFLCLFNCLYLQYHVLILYCTAHCFCFHFVCCLHIYLTYSVKSVCIIWLLYVMFIVFNDTEIQTKPFLYCLKAKWKPCLQNYANTQPTLRQTNVHLPYNRCITKKNWSQRETLMSFATALYTKKKNQNKLIDYIFTCSL